MNISVFIIECIIMAVLFGILVFGMLFTSPLTFISDYSPEIQEEYYRSQNREAAKKTLSKIMAVKKIAALLVLLFLFAWMAHKAGAETFVQGLLAAYGYMVVLAVFDTCFLDWILFANIKRIRLPDTEHMEKEYHQKWFHVKVMLPLLPVFAVDGVAIALLMTWIW